jgi:integrase
MGAQRKKFIGPTGDRTTVAELLQLVVEDYQIHGKRSLRRVRTAIDRLREHFPGWRAVDVTPDALKRYLQKRLEMGRALCTARNELNILKRGFRLGYELGKVDHVPTFPRIKLSNTRTGFVEADELERIVSHLPAALQPLTRFGYLTGWRWGEIATLRWSQVDFEAGIARLEPGTTKNDDGRTLPFRAVPELEALLLRQREHTTQVEVEKKRVVPHVFHRNGYRIKDIDRAWRIACAAAGCPDRVFHDLRSASRWPRALYGAEPRLPPRPRPRQGRRRQWPETAADAALGL